MIKKSLVSPDKTLSLNPGGFFSVCQIYFYGKKALSTCKIYDFLHISVTEKDLISIFRYQHLQYWSGLILMLWLSIFQIIPHINHLAFRKNENASRRLINTNYWIESLCLQIQNIFQSSLSIFLLTVTSYLKKNLFMKDNYHTIEMSQQLSKLVMYF